MGLRGLGRLTLVQASAILDAVDGTPMHAYVVVSLLTRVRTEELRALLREDVDLLGRPDLMPPFVGPALRGETGQLADLRLSNGPRPCLPPSSRRMIQVLPLDVHGILKTFDKAYSGVAYNTIGLGAVSDDQWGPLDPIELSKTFGVDAVWMNGPRIALMDRASGEVLDDAKVTQFGKYPCIS